MRYKISCSKTKTDKWGHILSSVGFYGFASTIEEAIERANSLSTKYRKHDVNILDMEGPVLKGSTIWCIYAYKAGRLINKNEHYFSLLRE